MGTRPLRTPKPQVRILALAHSLSGSNLLNLVLRPRNVERTKDMSPVEQLLSKLSKVRKTGHGKYTSLCPAHEDSSPSLSISEESDGRLLIHCFAACDPSSIMESLGLNMSDLYPKPDGTHFRAKISKPVPISNLIQLIRPAIFTVLIANQKVLEGKPLEAEDKAYLLETISNLNRIIKLGGNY